MGESEGSERLRERGSGTDNIQKRNEGESKQNIGKEGEAKERNEDDASEYLRYTGREQK